MRDVDVERFWAKASVGDPERCWNWNAGRTSAGYGGFYVGGRTLSAHRISYELTYGPIPEGLLIRHDCDNPPCVNPHHLRTGTVRDNSMDSSIRGRNYRGTRHHFSKMTPETVRQCREEHVRDHVSSNELADRYGITDVAMLNVLHGRVWKSVTHGVSVFQATVGNKRERVELLAAQGMKQTDIAREVGCTQANVSYLLKTRAS